jgi:glucose-6-phosphate 1-dehydrogenase
MSTPQVVRAQGMPAAAPAPAASITAQEPFTFVLFGATGDLSGRKILPALFALWQGHFLPESFLIVGVAIENLTDDQFREHARQSVSEHGRLKPASADEWAQFARHLGYQSVNFGQADSYRGLATRLGDLEKQHNLPGNRLFYLAVAPAFFASVIEQLSAHQLIRHQGDGPPWGRVVIEKPFGRDLASALALDQQIHRFLHEDQIFRIDHYLGKETVQNMLAFRFGNAIFEPLLNSYFVDHVQITVAETVGMEGKRGAYYDTAGALRDVGQNHLLQLLAFTAMNAPGGLKATNIRAEKLRVLQNLVPLAGADVARKVVRGQYRAGTVEGKPVPAYRDEVAVPHGSNTEAYVAMRVEIDNWRWAGVPFLLRTGKRMAKHVTEIAIQFKLRKLRYPGRIEIEHDGMDLTQAEANALIFRIQPDEGISLSFLTKRPGLGLALRPVHMEFDYETSFHQQLPEAYERLILDAVRGFQLLFMHSDEVDAQWQFVTPVLEAWQAQPPPDFPNYDAGSWGPAEAERLLEGCQGKWRQP